MNRGATVKLLCDSLAPSGFRLTTWELKYPRFIHSEFMTHRSMSKNSSSSRAEPSEKLIQRVLDDPAIPLSWGENCKGMQAKKELSCEAAARLERHWLNLRDQAVATARKMIEEKTHKQIANRILENFSYIKVVMSTVTLSNFFRLRDHPDAQPEIANLAKLMRAIYESSKPNRVPEGWWHLPYVSPEERNQYSIADCLKFSVARCARVSYLTHDGNYDVERDRQLHDMLIVQEPKHASPAEHQALALTEPAHYGNFIGWKQYRHTLENESAPIERYQWT